MSIVFSGNETGKNMFVQKVWNREIMLHIYDLQDAVFKPECKHNLNHSFRCETEFTAMIEAVDVQLGDHRACTLKTWLTSGLLIWTGIKCNWAVLIDPSNFIGLDCPNSDRKLSHLLGVVRLLLPFYRSVFHSVSFGKKFPVHRMTITRLGHNKNWLQGLELLVGAWSRWWGQPSSLQRKLWSSQLH